MLQQRVWHGCMARSPRTMSRRLYAAAAATTTPPPPSPSHPGPLSTNVPNGAPSIADMRALDPNPDNSRTRLATFLANTWIFKRHSFNLKANVLSLVLYKQCVRRAALDGDAPSIKFWYEDCALEPTFQNWFLVTQLHLWMIMARLRMIPNGVAAGGGKQQQYRESLYTHFFDDIDARLRAYKVNPRFIKSTMREFGEQMNGCIFAYDEALSQADSDAVMTSAIWRNIFASNSQCTTTVLAVTTRYVRANLAMLEKLSDEHLLSTKFKFLDADSLK